MQSARHRELEQLAVTHLPLFHRVAYRRLHDYEDARDAVQDAFLRASKELHQFRGEAKLSTWLGSIVIHEALMKLRRRTNKKVAMRVSDREKEQVILRNAISPVLSAEEVLILKNHSATLREHIQKLTEPHRVVLEMRMAGKMVEEIAEELNIPEGTVKARISRGKKILARWMN